MDPTVEEAIQRLKAGNASPEDARIAFNAGYQGGPNTQAYYKELGLLDPPQDVPQEHVAPSNLFDRAGTQTQPDVSNLQVSSPEQAVQYNPNTIKEVQEAQATEQPVQPENAQQTNNIRPDIESALNRGMQAWSPLAPTMIKGGDRSGEAKGYRAGATIQDRVAADNAKILQWNKQRAMDNTLADKVAAAQAQGKWKQNANALGAEGGASVVASQNEAVTPDIMAQKQYQSQQMDAATQNLAEVNARKVAAQKNRTKADMTDYNTQYQESRDAYTYNLSTANDQGVGGNKSAETKKEEPETETTTPETTEKPNGKVEDTQNDEPQQVSAETNQQSQAAETATQELSDDQKLKDYADEIEGIHKAVESMKGTSQDHAKELRDLKARYDEIKPLFDELAAKSKNPTPTPATPDFGMFDEKLSKVSPAILNGVNQRF